jgi:hypothetical protein
MRQGEQGKQRENFYALGYFYQPGLFLTKVIVEIQQFSGLCITG